LQINVSAAYGQQRFLSPAYRDALAACGTVDDLERAVLFRAADSELSKADVPVPAYKVSKAALNAGTRLLAGGHFKGSARVNCVDPGWCSTDMYVVHGS